MSDTPPAGPPAGTQTGQLRPERKLPARFYTEVGIVEGEGGFEIRLDGRPIRTPGRAVFVLTRRELAEIAAAEWRDQVDRIDPPTMPMTTLANTAIDRVTTAVDAVSGEIRAYASADLTCYRAASPAGLVARQADHWDPVLAWAEAALGARFILVAGIIHTEQPAASLEAVSKALAPMSPLELAAADIVTTLTGSALIALALAAGALEADAAWDAAHVDEDWQAEQWGADAEAMDRRARRRRDFDAAATVLSVFCA